MVFTRRNKCSARIFCLRVLSHSNILSQDYFGVETLSRRRGDNALIDETHFPCDVFYGDERITPFTTAWTISNETTETQAYHSHGNDNDCLEHSNIGQ